MNMHGTEHGYQRHYRNRIPACRPCLDAHRAHNLDVITRRQQPVEHGTAEGLKRHSDERTAVCGPCLDYACRTESDKAWRDAS